MLRVYGRFFARCRKCSRLSRIKLDTGLMDYNSATKRSMGHEFSYWMNESYECECGNTYSIEIEAVEYPVGTIESVKYNLLGNVEASNEPQICAYISPEEELQSENDLDRARNPAEIIYQMNDRQFELFAASVLHEMGYSDVRVTQRTRDGGFDFSAVEDRHGVINYIIGECKHFGPRRKVDEDIIRKLHDVQNQKNANTAMAVTSSTFTRVAKQRASEYRMTLWDINDLVRYGSHLILDYI